MLSITIYPNRSIFSLFSKPNQSPIRLLRLSVLMKLASVKILPNFSLS